MILLQLKENANENMDVREKSLTREKKALSKEMTFRDYIGLGVGSMIGVGWLVVAGDWIIRGGSLGAIIGFVLGGLLLTFIGICYAELTTAIPMAGGELAFSYKAFGTGPSFLTCWFLSRYQLISFQNQY